MGGYITPILSDSSIEHANAWGDFKDRLCGFPELRHHPPAAGWERRGTDRTAQLQPVLGCPRCATAGVRKITVHDSRRTHATLLYEGPAPPAKIAHRGTDLQLCHTMTLTSPGARREAEAKCP